MSRLQGLRGAPPAADDLSSPLAIALKVQGLIEQTNEKLDAAVQIEPARARDALVVLMAQLTAYRAQHPEARDALFVGAPPPRAELLELIEHWPYAELAQARVTIQAFGVQCAGTLFFYH